MTARRPIRAASAAGARGRGHHSLAPGHLGEAVAAGTLAVVVGGVALAITGIVPLVSGGPTTMPGPGSAGGGRTPPLWSSRSLSVGLSAGGATFSGMVVHGSGEPGVAAGWAKAGGTRRRVATAAAMRLVRSMHANGPGPARVPSARPFAILRRCAYL